jgi:hypothetical protein
LRCYQLEIELGTMVRASYDQGVKEQPAVAFEGGRDGGVARCQIYGTGEGRSQVAIAGASGGGRAALLLLPLGHKRFVLAGKRGLCWQVERPPATLCQHKSSQSWRLSARQHRDLVLAGA